jgi:cell division protein FtsL
MIISPQVFLSQLTIEIDNLKSQIDQQNKKLVDIKNSYDPISIGTQVAEIARKINEINAIPDSSYGSHPDPNIRAQQRANKGADIASLQSQISNLNAIIPNAIKPIQDSINSLNAKLSDSIKLKTQLESDININSKKTLVANEQGIITSEKTSNNSLFGLAAIGLLLLGGD